MRKENQLESCYKKCCFPVLDTGSPALVVSDRWDNLRKKIGRCRIKCGKTLNLMGFTLIELLVVVLIIGILAAVALPQYNKAVIKSRYATIKALTASIAQAQEVYYLANGKYATDFEELSVEMPAGKKDTSTTSQYIYDWGSCGLNSTMSRCTEARANMQFQIRFEHQDTEPGQRNCVAFSTDTNDIRNQICRQETKATTTCGSGTNYLVWAYQ